MTNHYEFMVIIKSRLIPFPFWSRRIYAWARTKHFVCHSVILSVCYPGMPL